MICLNEVLNFINKRFPVDCDWTNGNCYYFALMLKDRFPNGDIVYDLIEGHFLFRYKGVLYDYNGKQSSEQRHLVDWTSFDLYDKYQKQRIVRDCII